MGDIGPHRIFSEVSEALLGYQAANLSQPQRFRLPSGFFVQCRRIRVKKVRLYRWTPLPAHQFVCVTRIMVPQDAKPWPPCKLSINERLFENNLLPQVIWTRILRFAEEPILELVVSRPFLHDLMGSTAVHVSEGDLASGSVAKLPVMAVSSPIPKIVVRSGILGKVHVQLLPGPSLQVASLQDQYSEVEMELIVCSETSPFTYPLQNTIQIGEVGGDEPVESLSDKLLDWFLNDLFAGRPHPVVSECMA